MPVRYEGAGGLPIARAGALRSNHSGGAATILARHARLAARQAPVYACSSSSNCTFSEVLAKKRRITVLVKFLIQFGNNLVASLRYREGTMIPTKSPTIAVMAISAVTEGIDRGGRTPAL